MTTDDFTLIQPLWFKRVLCCLFTHRLKESLARDRRQRGKSWAVISKTD
ncbi:hypothetical protein [Halomicronema sp. CCY15110]|nr:hypothetical protein [Halomicronema sp. CCY15110]